MRMAESALIGELSHGWRLHTKQRSLPVGSCEVLTCDVQLTGSGVPISNQRFSSLERWSCAMVPAVPWNSILRNAPTIEESPIAGSGGAHPGSGVPILTEAKTAQLDRDEGWAIDPEGPDLSTEPSRAIQA